MSVINDNNMLRSLLDVFYSEKVIFIRNRQEGGVYFDEERIKGTNYVCSARFIPKYGYEAVYNKWREVDEMQPVCIDADIQELTIADIDSHEESRSVTELPEYLYDKIVNICIDYANEWIDIADIDESLNPHEL